LLDSLLQEIVRNEQTKMKRSLRDRGEITEA